MKSREDRHGAWILQRYPKLKNTSILKARWSRDRGDYTATVLGPAWPESPFHAGLLLHCGQPKNLHGFLGKLYNVFQQHTVPILHQ